MATTSQAVFDADLERINAELRRLDAVFTDEDGWQGIDVTVVPASLLRSYERLCQYGYASGLL